jgi:single-strand DNA-binding protein
MAGRSLNKVMLIGNIVRDPELRYTPQNTAACSLSVATNRSWTGNDGSEQEAVEYHRIVAWGKLGEICNQILSKGRKVYVEGRLQTRNWETKEGEKRSTTEIVADQVIALDSRGSGEGGEPRSNDSYAYPEGDGAPAKKKAAKKPSSDLKVEDSVGGVEDLADDIPF